MRGWAVAGALLVGLSTAALADDDPPPPPLAWERALSEDGGAPQFSPDGTCLAVATGTSIALLTGAGDLRWQQPPPNRWLRPDVVSVAAGCRWIAAGGDPGYRYVWLIDERGRGRRPIATHGTPRALAFSRDAKQLAIGTAAGRLYLVSVPERSRPVTGICS